MHGHGEQGETDRLAPTDTDALVALIENRYHATHRRELPGRTIERRSRHRGSTQVVERHAVPAPVGLMPHGLLVGGQALRAGVVACVMHSDRDCP